MISVVNKDFFTMRRYTTVTNEDTPDMMFRTLVNLYTDPKNAELHRYEKKAFLSFVFSSTIDPSTMSDDDIYNLMEKCEVHQYSMYTDKEYDNLKNLFPAELRYPSLIFEATTDYTAKNLCLVAMPIKGIVSTIRKSDMYKIYNGALVVCKVFKYQETMEDEFSYFNKILYVLADITAEFEFKEFIPTDNPKYGLLNSYAYSLKAVAPITNDDSPSDGIWNVSMSQRKSTSLIPYLGRQEDFFKPKDPNIFRLSDVPPGIYLKHHTIAKEIGSGKNS